MRTCDNCGNPLGDQAHGRTRWCADRCKMAAYRRRRDARTVREAEIVRELTAALASRGD